MNNGKGNKGWLWGAAIGAIAGSVTALLFAPKAGRELRKDIASGARQVGEKTQEVAGKVGEKTQQVVEKVGEQGAQLVNKVKETAEGVICDFQTRRAGKVAAEDEVQEVQVSGFIEETPASTEALASATEAAASAENGEDNK